jgi:predicted AlkP superfamily phosphohydrolase/phosphomutase/tetratricopeptide (TPR) repeat protein
MKKQKLIVVGWDSADWEIAQPLMDQGRMPQLKAMVDNGASGKLKSSPPYLSPMLWNTMATGKSPAEHGIVGFREFNPVTQAHQPISSTSRKVKSIWNMLSQEGLKTHVVGWFATYPAESINGVVVSDLFGLSEQTHSLDKAPVGLVSPEAMSEDLLTLRVSPDEIDAGLLEFFIPKIREINLERDPRPNALRKRLAELYSYHNAAVILLQNESTDFLTVYYHFIDWICHDFMELAPPQRAGVSDRDYELYSGVVDAAYVLQDLLLRDLLGHTDPDVNCMMISDHGFLSGDERPRSTANIAGGIAAWHRIDGMFVGAGPLFQRGASGLRASLPDLAPTLLHAFNLPVGLDMVGRVIDGFLSHTPPAQTIPSWELRGAPHLPAERHSSGSGVSAELLKQFEDLGYVSAEDEREEIAESKSRRENAWNLGVALVAEGRCEEALPHLEEAYFFHPEASHKALPLINCLIELGLIDESLSVQETLLDYGPANGYLSYHLAILARKRSDYEGALSWLEDADTSPGGDLHANALERGLIGLLDARYEEAEAVFRKAVFDRPTPAAQLGLCRALVMLKRFDEAEARLIEVLKQRPDYSVGWFTLGIIHENREDLGQAKEAYLEAIRWRPDLKVALYRKNNLEMRARESRGEFIPITLDDLDFRELPAEKAARLSAEKVTQLREASRARQVDWENELAYLRRSENPLAVFGGGFVKVEDRETIVIVSGLPRSGTSLMMQMLAAGGMTLQTDDERKPDVNNPRGFFEWEPIMRLENNRECMQHAVDKAVKVVSTQLRFLPRQYAYKIIWMDRSISEVAHSQGRMLQNEKHVGEAALAAHRAETLKVLRQVSSKPQSGIKLLEVNYSECITQSESIQLDLVDFLGDFLIRPEAVQQAVDASLYRNRAGKEKFDV